MATPTKCPHCNAEPFEQFLPRLVFRSGFVACLRLFFTGTIEYAVICRACKDIIGYEL